MPKKKVDVSIIIVHYHADKVLFNCIKSIISSRPKMSYEIVVADNDEKEIIKKNLLKISSKIVYVKSPENFGFGAGVNLAVQQATGTYLFILNPDTVIVNDTVDELYEFITKHKDAGIVSGVLLDKDGNPPSIIAVDRLTPQSAIFSFSFLHTLFPNNSIAKKFYTYYDQVKNFKQIASVNLGAAFIKKSLFDEIGGFDENFFLYYEDYDICKIVEESGYKNYIYKHAGVAHLSGRGGTEVIHDLNPIIKKSRFYYFKKHFGLFQALFIEMFLRTTKYTGVVALILVLSAFLLMYRLSDLMPFIGDQGWFYMSARDMVVYHHIPLVGITSSHIWLHQGPYWTYLLAGTLWLGHFNPVSGAYLSSFIGLFTVFFVYKIGSEVFSRRIGLIASLIYATSPMILMNSRIPYHTAPIGLLTLLLFYALYKWIHGYRYGLPVIILLLTILYNFETATFMLVPIFILLLIYGLYKKTPWSKDIFKPKLLVLSVFAWIVVMIPMILYDVHHGYPQTVKFIIWLGYKIATVFGYPKLHPDAPTETPTTMIRFANAEIQQLIFLKNAVISWIVLLIGFINLLWINKNYFKEKKYLQQYSLLALFFIIPAVGYVVEKTNSGAYLIVFFPIIAFMFALAFDQLMCLKKGFIPSLVLLLIFVGCNILALFQTNFVMGPDGYGFTLTQREEVAQQIIKESRGKEYNLAGRGQNSQYISFTMNYEYLAWWLGHGPVHKNVPVRFIIQEMPTQILLSKQVVKSGD